MTDNMTDNTTKADLDKLRDEKCIPVAREMLSDIAISLIPEDKEIKDQSGLVLKFLGKTLDLDLNITTEVQYLFQLMLGALSGLNATIQKCVTTPLDEERYDVIARRLLAILATSNIPLTNIKEEDKTTAYASLESELNKFFAEEKLNSLEIKHVIEKIFKSFTALNNLFEESLSQSSNRAEAKLFGIGSMDELTMKRLNEVLISPVEVKKE